MKVLNTIMTLALLFGFLAERTLPCDGLADLCVGKHDNAVVTAEVDADHTHDDDSSGNHHDECNDCICPCHAPIPLVERTFLEVSDAFTEYPPSPSLNPIHAGARPPSPIPLV